MGAAAAPGRGGRGAMRPWLRAALAITLGATAILAVRPDGEAPPVQPVARRAGTGAAPAAPARAGPSDISSRAGQGQPTPALPTRPADWPAPSRAALAAWQGTAAPAPLPPAAAAASAATATAAARPVFPYRWIGQLDDGGPPQLLLASAQRTVAVRLDTTLDGRWRLQRSADGALQALPLPDGAPLAVPGAPAAPPP